MATVPASEQPVATNASADANPNDELKMAIEVWKTVVEVQQHFNTIEMQIRNIAITVLTATIGAAVLTANQSLNALVAAGSKGASLPALPSLIILGKSFSAASLIIGAGLIAWWAFYFMDRWWYHQLLRGAVDSARFIEDKFKDSFPYLNLSSFIKQASPNRFRGIELHSSNKIDLFYLIVTVLLLILMLFVF